MKGKSEPTWIFHCRDGMEENLRDEAVDVAGAEGSRLEPGLVIVKDLSKTPPRQLVFERQRLPRAGFDLREETRPVTPTLAACWLRHIPDRDRCWTTHAFASLPPDAKSQAGHVRGIEKAFLRVCRDHFPSVAERWLEPRAAQQQEEVDVLQILLCRDGVWTSACSSAELSDPNAGGAHRMSMDPKAPSRSYLKMEEALMRSGLPVESGDRVLDLGAAPGGWTWAFLKRGCTVTAVDHGPLKGAVAQAPAERLQHVRADGMTYRPDPAKPPLDFLVSDMLVPPGKALGLLRRWIGKGWARNFIVTLKLPQQKAWPVIREQKAWLDRCKGFNYQIRHLYHNRQEVTLWGTLESSALATPEAWSKG